MIMKMKGLRSIAVLGPMAAGLALTPGILSAQQGTRTMAPVGTVNYIEGQV